MTSTFDYHNASLKGDPRWASASRWTSRAPIVVLCIFFLSVIEIALGAVWVIALQTNSTVPSFIQTLILPGLAFFNAVPSLHLHCLACRNPPILAIWFSTIFVVLFLASFMTLLVSCKLPPSATPLGLRKVECSTNVEGVVNGPTEAVWWVVVIFEIVMMLLYGVHAGMAIYVRKVEKKKEQEKATMGIDARVSYTTEEEAEKARQRWRELARYGEF